MKKWLIVVWFVLFLVGCAEAPPVPATPYTLWNVQAEVLNVAFYQGQVSAKLKVIATATDFGQFETGGVYVITLNSAGAALEKGDVVDLECRLSLIQDHCRVLQVRAIGR